MTKKGPGLFPAEGLSFLRRVATDDLNVKSTDLTETSGTGKNHNALLEECKAQGLQDRRAGQDKRWRSRHVLKRLREPFSSRARDDQDKRSGIDCNSASGTLKLVEPQSRQTTISGNTKTWGVLRFSRPGKWMATSAEISASLVTGTTGTA